ncbi:MAG: hypothetical protein ACI8RZ_002583 [Myxococcota bacterium]|jgi:hypothetical protein
MFIPALIIACGGKQTETEAPLTELVAASTEAVPAADAAPAAVDCAEGTAIYQQDNTPLRAPDDAAMQWNLTIHDTGYWQNTAPNGEKIGCLSADELSGFEEALAAAQIAAPPLDAGMARCMAMPMSEYTVTVGEQSATWKGPCGMNNPSESLSALMGSIEALSYGR